MEAQSVTVNSLAVTQPGSQRAGDSSLVRLAAELVLQTSTLSCLLGMKVRKPLGWCLAHRDQLLGTGTY